MGNVDDFIEKSRRLKTDEILKKGESLCEPDVYCPYCAREQDSTDVWESGLKPNSSDHEYECVSCEKKFVINATVYFSTYRGGVNE